MATGAAGDGLIRGLFDGCIFNPDSGINRRPYHKKQTCALHKSRGQCSHSTTAANNVSYPIRRAWSEGSFTLMASSSAASCAHSSPGSSPALATPTAASPVAAKAYLFPYKEE